MRIKTINLNNKEVSFDIQIQNDFFEDGKKKYRAVFPGNIVLTNIFEIGLGIFNFKDFLSKRSQNILKSFRINKFEDFPDEALLYILSGGDEIWKDPQFNLEWNLETAKTLMKEEIKTILFNAKNLFDLIKYMHYIKYEFFKNYQQFYLLMRKK